VNASNNTPRFLVGSVTREVYHALSRTFNQMISIVIPTRNAAQFIGACIQAVRAQDFPASDVEIIVVDNFSSDDTKAIAERHGVTVHQLGPERSAQRNFGAQQAKGDLLLFLDADMTLAPNAFSACATVMNNPEVVGCFIPERIKGTGFWIRVRDFERSFYNATVIDAVRCIRRQAFLDVGGYDTALFAAEDWDLDRRLLAKGQFVSATTFLEHNEGEFDFRRYVKKKAYYATNFSAYFAKWGRDAITHKQFGFWYRFIGVFLENGKWKRFLAHPIYALAMYWLRFLVGVVYLRSEGWSKR
jgi:glycosyltransferase involved in cell wall biosynthesis